MLIDKSTEFWAGLAAATLFVWRKSESKALWMRTVEASVSALMGYSVAPSAAQWAGGSEPIAVIVVTALGYLGLDVLTSVVADRALIRDIIIRRLGGKQ